MQAPTNCTWVTQGIYQGFFSSPLKFPKVSTIFARSPFYRFHPVYLSSVKTERVAEVHRGNFKISDGIRDAHPGCGVFQFFKIAMPKIPLEDAPCNVLALGDPSGNFQCWAFFNSAAAPFSNKQPPTRKLIKYVWDYIPAKIPWRCCVLTMLVPRWFEQDDLFCGVNNENSNYDAGNG